MPKLFVAALSVLLAGSLASCGPKNDDKNVQSEPTEAVTTTPTPTVEETPAEVAPASKLLVFVVENHSFDQMRSGMPYTYALATEFGHATDFTAIRHPSLPNYIAMASGSTQGITDDKEPSGHKLSGPSVFGQAIAAGRTAGAYADGMTTNCATTGGGDRYAPRHNPWTYFADEREDCLKYDLPFTEFDQDVVDGDLPDIAFAIPNNCNNAHDEDCPLEVADEWFRVQMDKVFAGPDWQSGKLAVVLTADEDDRESDNKVLTVVIHPSQKGNVVTNPLTHYSLSRLFSEITHTTPLANAQTAPSMAEAFGLPIA
ncbi:MAG: alkaline phosphatase family protein [Aeromicrobium sp.]